MELKIEVSQKRIESEIVSRLLHGLEEKMAEAIEARVESACGDAVQAFTDARIAAEVERVISAGWNLTDSYGRPTGAAQTIGGLVLARITANEYGRSSITEAVQQCVNKHVAAEFEKLLGEVRAKLKAMLDEQVADKLIGALNDALKLKR